MDDLNLINDFRLVFHAGSDKSDSEIRKLLRGLFSIRGMEDLAVSAHRHLFQAIKSGENFNDRCVYPCDVVELRDILSRLEIRSRKPIVLFSSQVMKQAVDGYNILLLLRCSPEDIDCSQAGGMLVCDTHRLDVRGRVVGVVLQKTAPFDTVRSIVTDTLPSCPVYRDAPVAGIDQKKVTASQKRRFRVRLPSLHVYETVVAESDIEAMNKVLAERWDRHPDSRQERRPARYSAEYWYYSGFWDSIIKETSSNNITKTAEGTPRLSLNDQESQVFDTILKIDAEFGLGQQYRVAGGWVRDKLLGKESDDIDIALDKMTGREFSDFANQYAKRYPDAPIGKRYVVEQNAEKSKHLETTALEIAGAKIDFVNLRTEDYASDSRVPEMQFGTPEEDASRRDLTINSLFYNVGTQQVEDYVGGLADLESMTLRTPLDPKQTFLDDPLRILRALRFHSRYEGSQLDPSLVEAMGDPDVHEAYRAKVATERAGPEILKLFSGATPEESVRILHQTGMDAALLNLPDFEDLHPMDMDQRNPHHGLNLLDHTVEVIRKFNGILAQNGIEGKDRALALMGSWFHDFGKRHPDIGKPKEDNPEHYSYHGHEDVSADLAESFLRSIGIGKDDRELVTTIVRQHMAPHAHDGGWSKRQMGKLRQNTMIPGQDRDDIWKLVMWHAHADAAAKSEDARVEDFPDYGERFNATDAYMSAPPPMKPLVDGRRIMEMFPTISPKTGFIGFINQRLLGEQQAGNVADEASAVAFVESLRSEVETTYGPPATEANMSNWYRRKVQADASSGASSGTDDHNAGQDSQTYVERHHEDQKHMVRYEPGDSNKFQVGDRVKRRQGPLSDTPLTGKVISKKNGVLKVKWEGGKDQEFDINDVELPLLVERV